MAATVALIMNMQNELLFDGLARSMPVWVADTPANAPLKSRLVGERKSLSITWFPLRESETLTAAAIRILNSLDDHFDEQAQPVGYLTLICFGALYEASLSADLAHLGFTNVVPETFGFVASK